MVMMEVGGTCHHHTIYDRAVNSERQPAGDGVGLSSQHRAGAAGTQCVRFVAQKAPAEECSTEAGICREISAGKIEYRASDRRFNLSKLQRLLRHGLLVMKTAAEADRTGDDDGANDQDTHGFSPPLRISDDDHKGCETKYGGISDTVETKRLARCDAQKIRVAGAFAILLRLRRLSHSLKGAITAKPKEDPPWLDTFSLRLWCFVFRSRRWPPSATTIVAGRAISAGS
jgi:hypothetical protein